MSMSAAARYEEVADALRTGIQTGEWGIGARLPTEQDLIESYDTSRTTVRQAIQELRNEGLVQVRHGVGVFVAPPRVVKRVDSRERLSRSRRERNESGFLAEAQAQSFTPSSNVKVSFEAAGEFGELLGIPANEEICLRDRVMRADGKPVQLATSRLPRSITRDTELEQVETGAGGAHARLEDLGYGPTYHREINRSRMPSAHEKRLLDVDGPVLSVRRFTYHHGQVIEINDMVMDGGSYETQYGWDAD